MVGLIANLKMNYYFSCKTEVALYKWLFFRFQNKVFTKVLSTLVLGSLLTYWLQLLLLLLVMLYLFIT